MKNDHQNRGNDKKKQQEPATAKPDTSKDNASKSDTSNANGPNGSKSDNSKSGSPKISGERRAPDASEATTEPAQHGGSGRGMQRGDAEDGAREDASSGERAPSNVKTFPDVRKGENQSSQADEPVQQDNKVDADEREGDTGEDAPARTQRP